MRAPEKTLWLRQEHTKAPRLWDADADGLSARRTAEFVETQDAGATVDIHEAMAPTLDRNKIRDVEPHMSLDRAVHPQMLANFAEHLVPRPADLFQEIST